MCARLCGKQRGRLKKWSVVYWAGELSKNSSLLIFCGSRDDRDNPAQADALAEKLIAPGYDVALKKFDTGHFFSDKKAEPDACVIGWFHEKLKNRR